MNPGATPSARPDLDVALLNFADEYALHPEPALYRLQLLLLDEDTCLARVALLRTLAASAGRESSHGDVRQAVEAFRPEIALLLEEGLFAAHAAGRLTPERVRRLDQLTRAPEALLEAHRRLAADDHDATPDPAAGAPPAAEKDDTALPERLNDLTVLARAGRVADLEERLRPWLPLLLRRAGLTDDLDEALARQFLAYARTRVDEVRHRRFRELLPVWLSDFARRRDLAGRLRTDGLQPTPADLEADAVERVLRRAGENESAWAKGFRESALRARVRTAQDLLSFEAAEVGGVPALPNYRRDLFREARRAYRDGLELFECDVTA
jgi:hypothetical protein